MFFLREKAGGAGLGFSGKEVGKEETSVESSYQEGKRVHLESWYLFGEKCRCLMELRESWEDLRETRCQGLEDLAES